MPISKSLLNWYQSNDISNTERNKILEIGCFDNSPQLYLSSWRKLYYYQLIIDRLRSQINISGTIQNLILFSAHWNPNCVIVISGDNYYELNLLVYEMPFGQINENLEKIFVNNYSSFSSAKSSAYEIERRLNSDNPISFYEHEITGKNFVISAKSWSYLGTAFPFSKSVELAFQAVKNNPDAFFKPLDIVKVSEFCGNLHTAIYLGNKKVAHNLPSGGVRVADWENFVSFGGYGNTYYGRVVRYHPMVAYKSADEIIQNIAKIMGGNFNIYKNNCENFANKCIYGWDVSEHADQINSKCEVIIKENGTIINSCGSNIKMACYNTTSTEMRENFDRLPRNYQKENEIGGYVQSSSHFEGIKLEQRIEIIPKSGYRMN